MRGYSLNLADFYPKMKKTETSRRIVFLKSLYVVNIFSKRAYSVLINDSLNSPDLSFLPEKSKFVNNFVIKCLKDVAKGSFFCYNII